MSFTPATLSPVPKHKKADDFAYSFQFVEDSSPLDLSTKDDVVVELTTNSATIFSQSSADGENTISSSSGSNNDIISGTVAGETMDVATTEKGRVNYFLEVYTMLDGKKTTYVSSVFNIIGKGNSGTAHEWEITITNSTDSATGERATNVLALAVAAKDAAEAAAAGLNLPSIVSGDADKFLQVLNNESGYELQTASEAGIATETYVDDKASLFTATETYQIPTDYATLQGAIDDLTRKRQDKAGVEIVLNIESGHQPASGISVASGDYSKFRITSTDAEVVLAAGFTGSFIDCSFGAAPVLDAIIDMNGEGSHGYRCQYSSRGYIVSGNGFRRCPQKAIYAHQGSVINAQGAIVTDNVATVVEAVGATRGSTIVLNFATITNSATQGVGAAWNSHITMRGATCTGHADTAINCIDASSINAIAADISNAAQVGVNCTNGSTVNFNSGVATNMGAQAIIASNGGIVSCVSANLDSPANTEINCEGGGIIFAEGATYASSNIGTNDVTTDGIIIDSAKGRQIIATRSGTQTSLSSATNLGALLRLRNDDPTDNNFTVLENYDANNLNNARIAIQNLSHAGRTARIAFLTSNGASPQARLFIENNGHLVPANDESYNLGAFNNAWGQFFMSGSDAETNPSAIGGAARQRFYQNDPTDNNYISREANNSNGSLAAKEVFQFVSHSGRTAAWKMLLSNGGSPQVRLIVNPNGDTTPGADNTQKLGGASNRWSEVFAGNGTINTSDEREKEIRGELTKEELKAWSKVQTVVYQWKDSIKDKGEEARLHVGYIAQQVQEAFESEGLDAFKYGLLCKDEIFEEKEVQKTKEVEVPVTKTVEVPYKRIEMIDGAPVQITEIKEEEQPVYEELEVVDENGDTVYTEENQLNEHGKPIKDEDGNVVTKKIPLTHSVQKTIIEEKEFTVIEKVSAGYRYGLRYEQCLAFECAYLRSQLK